MALFFNKPYRQSTLAVMDALQQLEDNPEQLSLQRAYRYSDSPPPYTSSRDYAASQPR